MPSIFKIYGLIDPRSHELYYVGQTCRALHDRMDEHFFESNDTLVSKKNQAIMGSNQQPHIILLDTAANDAEAFHKELYWIHFWCAQGKKLKNREAQNWFRERYDDAFSRRPLPAKPKRVTRRKSTAVIPALGPEIYVLAKKIAPAEDIEALEKRWRSWLAQPGKTLPKHPDRAFLAFCKRVAASS